MELYVKDKMDEAGQPVKVVYEQVNPRWEVGITLSDRGFQQVSFVNSIATTKVFNGRAHGQATMIISYRGGTLPFIYFLGVYLVRSTLVAFQRKLMLDGIC